MAASVGSASDLTVISRMHSAASASSGGACAPRRDRAERFGDREARAQAVLVKAVAGPGAAEPGVPPALDFVEALLRRKGRRVVLRMLAEVAAEGERGLRLEGRIEADEQRPVGSMPCSAFIQ